jgi:hypothetical protein
MAKRLISMGVVGIIAFLLGLYAGRPKPTYLYAQAPEGNVASVPKAWGSLKSGWPVMAFEDSNGTIRLLNIEHFCQGDGTPKLVGTVTRK